MALGMPSTSSFTSNSGKSTGSGSGKSTGSFTGDRPNSRPYTPRHPQDNGAAGYWGASGLHLPSFKGHTGKTFGSLVGEYARTAADTTANENAAVLANAKSEIMRFAKPQIDLLEVGRDIARQGFQNTLNQNKSDKRYGRAEHKNSSAVTAIDIAMQQAAKDAAAGDIHAIERLRSLMAERHQITLEGFDDDRRENRQSKRFGIWENNKNATSAAAWHGTGRRMREQQIGQGFRHTKRDIGRSVSNENSLFASGNVEFDRQVASNQHEMTIADYMIQKLGLNKDQADRVLDQIIDNANLSKNDAMNAKSAKMNDITAEQVTHLAGVSQQYSAANQDVEMSNASWFSNPYEMVSQIRAGDPAVRPSGWLNGKPVSSYHRSGNPNERIWR